MKERKVFIHYDIHLVIFIKKEIPGLIIPGQAKYFEAFGAALRALEAGTEPVKDPAELFSDGESDLYGTAVYCEECSRKIRNERCGHGSKQV